MSSGALSGKRLIRMGVAVALVALARRYFVTLLTRTTGTWVGQPR